MTTDPGWRRDQRCAPAALVAAWVPGDPDHVRDEVLPGIETDLIEPVDVSGVEVRLGGSDEVFRVVGEQAASDFLRAELIIVPLVTLCCGSCTGGSGWHC